VIPRGLGETVSLRSEKRSCFRGDPVDSNHKVSPAIVAALHSTYRQERPYLFDLYPDHISPNPSV
jgi:hypothetical protein